MNFSKCLTFLILFSLVMLCGACKSSSDTIVFSEINKALANNLQQLNKEAGIIQSGISSDPQKKVFKIGIAIDRNILTNERLKQVIDTYLESSIASTSEQDWKKLMLPYTLKIEEMENGKTDFLLAEKQSGKTVLIWRE
ncbi:hypothetical protein QFZ81_003847 [Paenibacillus sp. V4I9]|uniref:hypothetical protein n=1 Tax=Paenibacillus sp. V4I9 TaxID=3042308 RepID=UPI002789BC4E|nr:hypothetical protein [Paenibacillus sp. V4I9]MDQ0888759.1 hypothetical protein [Paenibacillus sp. V4I9]